MRQDVRFERGPRFGLTVLGFTMHIAVGALVSVSGLLMPEAAVAWLGALWALGLGTAIVYPTAAVAIAAPLVTLGVWGLAVWIGDTFLGYRMTQRTPAACARQSEGSTRPDSWP